MAFRVACKTLSLRGSGSLRTMTYWLRGTLDWVALGGQEGWFGYLQVLAGWGKVWVTWLS